MEALKKEIQTTNTNNNTDDQSNSLLKRWLLLLSCTCLALGSVPGNLISRLYFTHGGNRKWLACWLHTCGFPILLIPLSASYILRRRRTQGGSKLWSITPSLVMACAFIGLLTGIDDYMYALGISYLPVSTYSILTSSQLAFTALFSFLLVKQKFTPYSINSVVLLTLAAVALGLHTHGDRPENVSNTQYYLGFSVLLAASILEGFILTLVEKTCAKAGLTLTYTLVMEMQFIISLSATAFCTVGMYVNNDFKVIPREGREFELGEMEYYVILVVSGIVWQLFFIGSVSVIFCASSLVSGITMAAMIPIIEVLAVFIFHERFSGEKGLSLTLSLWGFVSYFYGEHRNKIKKSKTGTVMSLP